MPLRAATPADDAALSRLFGEIDLLDGYFPLTEDATRAMGRGEGEGYVVTDDGSIVGFAHRRRTPEGVVVETAILPWCRPVQAHRALQAAVADLGEVAVHLWASDGETVAAAEELGFVEHRRLIQLHRSLPISEVPRIPTGVTISTFTSGDEEELIAVNNEAFADHPDNGEWDLAELEDRMSRPWYDPAGLLIARSGRDMVSFCWTKLHPGDVGEIYVIGVHPDAQGIGLGRASTLLGMAHMHDDRGATTGMLYAESTNPSALHLYATLGFEELRVKRGLTRL